LPISCKFVIDCSSNTINILKGGACDAFISSKLESESKWKKEGKPTNLERL